MLQCTPPSTTIKEKINPGPPKEKYKKLVGNFIFSVTG
jgi:hypothetical protein